MNIDTILAIHPADHPLSALVPLAGLVRALDAHLDVIVLDVTPAPTEALLGTELAFDGLGLEGPAFDGLAYDGPAFDGSRFDDRAFEEAEARADAVRTRLSALSIVANVRGVRETPPTVTHAIATESLCTDLVVLTGGGGSYATGPVSNALAGALFEAGRPALILQPDQASLRLPCRHAVIGWDGGRRAVAAIERALPLLVRADEVELVSVGHIPDAERRHSQVRAWLRHHGIEPRLLALAPEHGHVHHALREHVRETQAGLLVAGAWNHGRLRERLFSGTTHGLLSHPEVPMLLAH